MLPSSQRVKKTYFKEIFKKGVFWQDEHVYLITLNDPKIALKSSKFAFSVSQKVVKTAVGRNKLRRCGYSVLRGIISDIKPSYLGVFVLKKGVEKLSFQDYKKEVENLLSKAKLI